MADSTAATRRPTGRSPRAAAALNPQAHLPRLLARRDLFDEAEASTGENADTGSSDCLYTD